MAKSRGDSVPIKKYKMKEGEKYMPYPYGPMPKAKHRNRPKGDHDQRVNV